VPILQVFQEELIHIQPIANSKDIQIQSNIASDLELHVDTGEREKLEISPLIATLSAKVFSMSPFTALVISVTVYFFICFRIYQTDLLRLQEVFRLCKGLHHLF